MSNNSKGIEINLEELNARGGNNSGFNLQSALDDIDRLAGYLKILHRSNCYREDSYRDCDGRLRDITEVFQGGDSEITGLCLDALSLIHNKVLATKNNLDSQQPR
jgi:hypothetical protein